MRALIIEDELLLAWTIEDVLGDLGYRHIDFASSERQAINLAERNRPDLIIADSRLSEGSGVEAVRAICASRNIPTVFVTGDRDSVITSIADAIVLDKPLSNARLVELVQHATA